MEIIVLKAIVSHILKELNVYSMSDVFHLRNLFQIIIWKEIINGFTCELLWCNYCNLNGFWPPILK